MSTRWLGCCNVGEKSDDLVPLDEARSADSKAAAPSVTITFKTPKKRGPRKKKLHWDALDKSKLNRNSIWVQLEDDDEDDLDEIDIDADEFNSLFVEVVKSPKKAANRTTAENAGSATNNGKDGSRTDSDDAKKKQR